MKRRGIDFVMNSI